MIDEHRQVVLTEDLPALGLKAGDVGVVVHTHVGNRAYEVEFMTLDGETVAIETVEARQIGKVRLREMPHVRTIDRVRYLATSHRNPGNGSSRPH